MSELYEDYYREITDGDGKIVRIDLNYDNTFNFA